MWKRILEIFLWIVFAGGVTALLGFIETEKQKIRCTGVEISIDYQNAGCLLTKNEIRKTVQGQYDSLEGIQLAGFDCNRLEQFLCEQDYIEDADVYYTVDGTLKILARQRVPVLRVITSTNQSFYIDRQGMIMPVNKKYPQRILVANGDIKFAFTPHNQEAYNKWYRNDSTSGIILPGLFKIGSFIYNNSFYKALIEQVYVNQKNEFELIPLLGKHVIEFGNAQEMQEKFGKLESFYKSESFRKSGAFYKSINLKYSNQVVCTKY